MSASVSSSTQASGVVPAGGADTVGEVPAVGAAATAAETAGAEVESDMKKEKRPAVNRLSSERR